MTRTNALITLLFLFCSASIFAQEEQKKEPQKKVQKSHSYKEAVELLTAQDDEFSIKGELPPLPTIGQQLHEIRIKHNISLSTLSFVAGLAEETLIKIEEDKITPTREIITKVEDFLGEEIILIDY